ncbi:uncharacterized protein BO95DRAFT_512126 [Aspergillus brunneoviolaceus CBS 621.78]|uniref:Uncharacterized protein n=2 Tax=Aspergillus TaxID=5052 RepID=A0A8G1VZK5_9EURO|nr:hypothetical protein BO95DRAFT_512126 [Aspergillus brunneoviolaceus CBS 621.78]XP_040801623.1 uncharacterized protein BO72DRAFT_495912 [Aspergillus fijiensis CBS 313.89]RAH48623.1 hypothetical protein BO95DRAFT_512126 [Aspergillus brunneoviolaceus CBS 621.78]RAK77613.1 hypothetical protein BO72DRAFT_495912 [Aspergillus fijiensis CBS 313.89]
MSPLRPFHVEDDSQSPYTRRTGGGDNDEVSWTLDQPQPYKDKYFHADLCRPVLTISTRIEKPIEKIKRASPTMKPELSPYQDPLDHTPRTTTPPPAYITIDLSGSAEVYGLEAYPSTYNDERPQPIYVPPQSTVTVTATVSEPEPERRRRQCPPLSSIITEIVMTAIIGGAFALTVVAIVFRVKDAKAAAKAAS